MNITATYLRQHIYALLDRVLATGDPLVIERNGRKLKIVPVTERKKRRLEDIPERDDIVIGDPEELVHIDWSNEWHP
jgi:PHD/YefM family antitoxin component YafN of YafNO toxin-antitoxin module